MIDLCALSVLNGILMAMIHTHNEISEETPLLQNKTFCVGLNQRAKNKQKLQFTHNE